MLVEMVTHKNNKLNHSNYNNNKQKKIQMLEIVKRMIKIKRATNGKNLHQNQLILMEIRET